MVLSTPSNGSLLREARVARGQARGRTHSTKRVMTHADTRCTPSSALLGGMLDRLACANEVLIV